MNLIEKIGLNRLGLKGRTLSYFLVITLIPLISLSLFSVYSLRENIYKEKKRSLRNAAEIALSEIEFYFQKFQSSEITMEVAKQQAAITISSIRYGLVSKDYFWIQEEVDGKPYMVMHPFKPEMNGTDLSTYEDTKGKHIFIEFMNVAEESSSGGYVSYYWQYYDDATKIVPKLSFVIKYDIWGWVIGTGIYINDVDALILEQLTIVSIFSLIVAIICIIAGFLISASLTKPIQLISSSSKEVASGDLTVNVSDLNLHRSDELGELVLTFGSMLDSLKKFIGNTQESATHLASSSEELVSTSEEVNALSEEIAATIQQISRGASNQSNLSAKALEDLNKMSEVVDRSFKDIEGTLQIIEDIASQTNILALNAAIEAARAGEYGRGFAVVADNVRRLAEETKVNSAEIGKIVEEIISNIGGSVFNLQETLQSFAAQSEEFSASSEEVAAATEEQTAAMNQMTTSAQDLTRLSDKMSLLISKYKIE